MGKDLNRVPKRLDGLDLAEDLLHRSCKRAMERTKSDKRKAYIGVKCYWDKPSLMKKSLMADNKFWIDWVDLFKIYEENDRLLNFRPTIDKIESDIEFNGHYTLGNIRALSYSENSQIAQPTKCIAIFFKNGHVSHIVDYYALDEVMSQLGIKSYNALNLVKNTGRFFNLQDNISILLQTFNGKLQSSEKQLYRVEIETRKYIVDYQNGQEYEIGLTLESYFSSGMWIDANSVFRK